MKWDEFYRWFNRDFWRAFSELTIPIAIPSSEEERHSILSETYQAIRTARYAPSTPEVELVYDKGHGVTRIVPVFCIRDYIVYYYCVRELEDVISGNRTEHTFGGWSLGGRLRRQEEYDIEYEVEFSNSRYAFDPRSWVQAFGQFNSLLYAQLDTGRYANVLQFDLSNFYDSIRLDILERWIREDAPAKKSEVIALLFYFLNHWNRRNTSLHPQSVGIPQDALADCSRLLANYYLQRYDRYASTICNQAGATYFRYADDQMVLLRHPKVIRPLMLLLTRKLDQHGLRVNQKKCICGR